MLARIARQSASRFGLGCQTRALGTSQPLHAKAGMPVIFHVQYDTKGYNVDIANEFQEMPRDEFGVPAHIPPELSTAIKHTFFVPPQYYPWLKKLGDDTPELKPYTDKLINGDLTFRDYEEMFYNFSKPLKIHRDLIPMPYRTEAEIAREAEVAWEGAWYSFRQRVKGDYMLRYLLRDMVTSLVVGAYFGYIYLQYVRYYRMDMKQFYVHAPEHKINWVVPRGDL